MTVPGPSRPRSPLPQEVAKDASLVGTMVFWLVVQGFSGGVSVIPVPYFTEAACEEAVKHTYRGECVPQPFEDVRDWVIAN